VLDGSSLTDRAQPIMKQGEKRKREKAADEKEESKVGRTE